MKSTFFQFPQKLIADDLASELLSLSEYRRIKQSVCDETCIKVLAQIMIDEEAHIKILSDLLYSEF